MAMIGIAPLQAEAAATFAIAADGIVALAVIATAPDALHGLNFIGSSVASPTSHGVSGKATHLRAKPGRPTPTILAMAPRPARAFTKAIPC